MPKSFFLFAGAMLALTLALLATAAPSPQATSTNGSKTAAENFKNIQVLKNIPADQLIPTMQFISASLGVECDFCHVGHEMDKDDKKTKKVAREMMQMMFAINKNNFDGEREVTCNTCHRGSPHPQAIPAILAEGPQPEAPEHDAAPEPMDKWPSGDAVVAQYVDALGGQTALDKISTRIEKGSALLPGGHSMPIEVFTKSPNQRVSVLYTPNGDSVTAYNGHEGWLASPGRPVRPMSAADQSAAKIDATVFFPEHLADLFEQLKLQPHPEEVGGRAATVVVGLNKGQPPTKFYFDPQSGILLRVVHYIDTALGLNPIQVDFNEYREAGGVKTPVRWTLGRPRGSFTIQIDDVQNNAPIDAAKFVMPPLPPPGAAGGSQAPAH